MWSKGTNNLKLNNMIEYETTYNMPVFKDDEPLCGNPNCVDGWVIEIIQDEFGNDVEDKCTCKICN